jgi:hypothetical protein
LCVAQETCMDEARRKADEDNHGECTLWISPITPRLLEFRARNSSLAGHLLQTRREIQQYLQAFIRLQSYNSLVTDTAGRNRNKFTWQQSTPQVHSKRQCAHKQSHPEL